MPDPTGPGPYDEGPGPLPLTRAQLDTLLSNAATFSHALRSGGGCLHDYHPAVVVALVECLADALSLTRPAHTAMTHAAGIATVLGTAYVRVSCLDPALPPHLRHRYDPISPADVVERAPLPEPVPRYGRPGGPY